MRGFTINRAGASHASHWHVVGNMPSHSHSVSQAIRKHNAGLTDLYFQHRETVQQLRSALLTQILPNVIDELGLGDAARDWAQEWLQDDRTSLLGPVISPAFLIPLSTNYSVYIPHPEGEGDYSLTVSCARQLKWMLPIPPEAQVHKGICPRVSQVDPHLAPDSPEKSRSGRLFAISAP